MVNPMYNFESNAFLILLTNDLYGRGELTLNQDWNGSVVNDYIGTSHSLGLYMLLPSHRHQEG